MALVYELTKQYPYKVEEVIAKFTHEKDAVDYLKERAHRDHVTKVETTWRLYHQNKLIHEISSTEGTEGGETSESPGSGNRLSPSPLSTSLRPPGSLPAREQDDKNEDDDI